MEQGESGKSLKRPSDAAEELAPWRVVSQRECLWCAVRAEEAPGKLLGFLRVDHVMLREFRPGPRRIPIVGAYGLIDYPELRLWADVRPHGTIMHELSIGTRQPIEWWRCVADFVEAAGEDHAAT